MRKYQRRVGWKVSASYVRVEGSPPLGDPNKEVYATWLDLTSHDRDDLKAQTMM
jgi:hypothetical protein